MHTDETESWESERRRRPERRGRNKNERAGELDYAGWIEVICGSMFSGKTEELIRRLKRAKFANQTVEIFKPQVDVRYSEEEVVSHDTNAIRCTPVDSPGTILLMATDVDVVAIDEAQFFDESLVEVCTRLADSGVRVIIAGLDMDYTGKPFGPMPALLAKAEYITKVHAICLRCGGIAQHSHRLTQNDKLVLLGETDSYEPLCRHCFNRALARASRGTGTSLGMLSGKEEARGTISAGAVKAEGDNFQGEAHME